MYKTYIGASLISMTLLSVIIWATNNELQYTVHNWQPSQICQYTNFSIKESDSPWSVMMTGMVTGNNTSSCNSTNLHYFTEYDTSPTCDGQYPYFPNPPLKRSDITYNGLPADDKTLCNYTDLQNQLTNSLYRPFTCLVNQACTRLEPWRSNDYIVKFYIVVLVFEGLAMCCLALCFAVTCLRSIRERNITRRFASPHPPVYAPPPQYTMYMP